jgi:hypothetical protein
VRKTLLTLALVGLFAGMSAAPAAAGPKVPSVPQDCNELNALLGINNVQDCDHS